MRILMLHNRYLQSGGEDATVSDQVALLRAYGHEVTLLMRDNRVIRQRPLWQTALGTVWSPSAYRWVQKALRSRRYDVVHVHNFFPLFSPSVYYAAQSAGVPVIQTLHNYRLMCLNGYLLRAGQPCEACLQRRWPWPGVYHRCYRRSWPASATVAVMLSVHRGLRTWRRRVDLFVTFSRFARQKFVQIGLPPERLLVMPHFVHPDPGVGKEARECVLFVGRLEQAKGIEVLLDAWRRLRPAVPFCVVGDGPLAEKVRAARAWADVRFLGWRSAEEVQAYLRRAHLLVAPSIAYETFGRVVIEAFAAGTPAIVTEHGALAELVTPGETGWHVPPAHSARLAEQLRLALGDLPRLRHMGRAARRVYEARYTARKGYEHLMAAYRRVGAW